MVHNAPWGRKPLLQLHLFHVKDSSALQLHAQQIPHSLHFIARNPTAKFLIDSTAYLGQIEVSDYFLKPSLKVFHSFLCSVFLFFLPPPLHSPPFLSACWEVPASSLEQPVLHFQGLHSNPWLVTSSMFLSFSLPGNILLHTLCSGPILSHADATCFSGCHMSRDNLCQCLCSVTFCYSVREGVFSLTVRRWSGRLL